MTILTAKIEIDPADIANALTLSALAKALMDKLSATARTPGSLEIPCIGAMWPEQGGIYAGIMRGEFGHGYHLIIAPVDAELIDLEWGDDDFKMIDGAISDRDGLKNSLAIRDYARSVEKSFPAACLALNNATNGFTDWYLPARHEARLAYLNAPETFNTDAWYWTSTQYANDASGAWNQDFEYGEQFSQVKGCKGRVRAIRRVPITEN